MWSGMIKVAGGAFKRALQRALGDVWPIIQGSLAATAAWVIGKYGFDHPQPFFAPIAALVSAGEIGASSGTEMIRETRAFGQEQSEIVCSAIVPSLTTDRDRSVPHRATPDGSVTTNSIKHVASRVVPTLGQHRRVGWGDEGYVFFEAADKLVAGNESSALCELGFNVGVVELGHRDELVAVPITEHYDESLASPTVEHRQFASVPWVAMSSRTPSGEMTCPP
jgi:hypothetical protein